MELRRRLSRIPFPHFDGHGLSTIPCKSALWLDHRGERIGPEPLVTGFDTHWLCQRVAEQEQPWTWQLLNWRIAAKEFAISGAEHNQRIRDRQFLRFLAETLFGNHRLVRQMQRESPDFLVDDTLAGLAAKMNALTARTTSTRRGCRPRSTPSTPILPAPSLTQRRPDPAHPARAPVARRTACAPASRRRCSKRGAGPVHRHPHATGHAQEPRRAAHRSATAVCSTAADAPIAGLYCVGEAAGFGGGGSNGKRSLEGTFLPGCILTAHAAVRRLRGGG